VALELNSAQAGGDVGKIVVVAGRHAEVVDHRAERAGRVVDVATTKEGRAVLSTETHFTKLVRCQAHPALPVPETRPVGLRAGVGAEATFDLEFG
jgi:hypothetical protein